MAKDISETDLAYLSVDQLIDGYSTARFSPVDVTHACLNRIEAYNAQVNAFCFVDTQGALAAAARSAARWKSGMPLGSLDGVPASSKDTTHVKGWQSSFGSQLFGLSTPATESAPCVDRLLESGAVLLGLTTSPEIGWKGVTDSPRHGITRNPWNTGTTPGGSSGGAAVAAALGMGALHVGTDAGGSVRIPAAFTGVFGHKPSFGRVPNYPPSPFSTLAHVGPITRTVSDAAHMLTAISRPDMRDWAALPPHPQDFHMLLNGTVSGLKIGVCTALDGTIVQPEIAEKIQAAAQVFTAQGASIQHIELPFAPTRKTIMGYWHAAVSSRLGSLSEEELLLLDPGLVEVFMEGRGQSLPDYFAATQSRTALGMEMNKLFQTYDLILTPTLPLEAFTAGRAFPDDPAYADWMDWAGFCYPLNLTRHPACSVPCGFTKNHLPVGLQIIGKPFDDSTVLRAAAAYERLHPAPMPQTPLPVSP